MRDRLTLFLCGDVMLGRGVDQILPCPGDPALREQHIRDARTYVALAEAANGPVRHPVPFTWPWGEVLPVLAAGEPDVRILNLETSVTRSDQFAPGKGVHYRMSPANLPCLTAVRPDVCVLANNHVLDFGRRGLQETLEVLAGAGLRVAGAGRDASEARRPAAVPVDGGGRVLVFAFGMASSGVPSTWAATADQAGIWVVPVPSRTAAAEVAARVGEVKRPGDVVVASLHWGSNWGYDVCRDEVRFAHLLVDGGVDVVHGHSSHHPRPVEVYRDRLVLYGCGDVVNDYEGIKSHPAYRSDLRLLYLASVDPAHGALVELRAVPLRARRMRLERASRTDTEWLRAILDRTSSRFGSHLHGLPDGTLVLRRSQP